MVYVTTEIDNPGANAETNTDDDALAVVEVESTHAAAQPAAAANAAVDAVKATAASSVGGATGLAPALTAANVPAAIAPAGTILFGAALSIAAQGNVIVEDLYLKYAEPLKMLKSGDMPTTKVFFLVAAVAVDARRLYRLTQDDAKDVVLQVVRLAMRHNEREDVVITLVEPMLDLAFFYAAQLKPAVLGLFTCCRKNKQAVPSRRALQSLNVPTPKAMVRRARDPTVVNIAAQAGSVGAIADELYTLFAENLGAALTQQGVAWPSLVARLMVAFQQYQISGATKKELALAVMEQVIANNVPPNQQDAARLLVAGVISPAIDAAIAFSHDLPGKLRGACEMCCM